MSEWRLPFGPWILSGLISFLILLGLLKNKKIVQYYLLTKFARRNDDHAFIQAYERLLWLLAYVGWQRKDGETLREYAGRIDKQYDSTEMLHLTTEYEKIMYGGQVSTSSWIEQKNHWMSLVRKIDS
ncbi:DUF4129 domain-containing protein [Halalkalibacter akibai]|uniref:Protein-glutamine gamma-glutamyltransferase-like C-terminal domain-containing protein n=1 Tax=Halalkalibacter akibai (strain ATCC 43226 / DSM 21942 / CIP 109018 / JCM 9157 / 1139) TaxID=1236973 RepID=W4R0W0_HALA3|nr:DUF4129 domain-containing protein [Halalkalibacter akibai]GAE37533.1 hypothetical protein JCM9157_4842 [Halalkalibacter akibai JCM 9157]